MGLVVAAGAAAGGLAHHVVPSFAIRHDLVHDLYAHLLCGGLFLLGWASRGVRAAGFWPW